MARNALQPFLFALLAAFLISKSTADVDPCRYDDDKCSCKIGAANQGICWDKIANLPGQCTKRFCRAGWTCACAGRTHVCNVGPKTVNALKNEADAALATAECESSSRSMVQSQDIILGTLKLHISRPGLKANDCAQIAWWHNGVLLGNRKIVDGISTADDATVDAELSAREDHSLLELRPGDLIAFRFKEASYYCYNHFAEMVINGVPVTSSSSSVTTFYARGFSENWFLPSFLLTADKTAADESEPDLTKFLPLRKNKLSSNTPLIDGTDYWEPRDDSNADNKRSNWYYRIEIAENLSGPTSEL